MRVLWRQMARSAATAATLEYGETRLLTFNAADFTRFNRLIEIVVP